MLKNLVDNRITANFEFMKIKMWLAMSGSLLCFCVGLFIGYRFKLEEGYRLCEPIKVLRKDDNSLFLRDGCNRYVLLDNNKNK